MFLSLPGDDRFTKLNYKPVTNLLVKGQSAQSASLYAVTSLFELLDKRIPCLGHLLMYLTILNAAYI